MRLFIFLMLYAAIIVAAFVGPSHAQEARCAPHDTLSAALARTFKETVVSMGLIGNGQMLEVYASEKGTWTIVYTLPNGISCMVASGSAFEQITAKWQPPGVPG